MMRLFRRLLFSLLILFAFVTLSSLYINGIAGSLKLINQLYLTPVPKKHHSSAINDTPHVLDNPELQKIEKEIELLLQEIEEENKKPSFSKLKTLPNITTIKDSNLSTQIPKILNKSTINQIIVKEMPKELQPFQVKSKLFVDISISKQRMKVYQNGELLHHWKVSTGRRGYATPTGQYQPKYLVKMHYSKKYHNSPMPYSIFFHGGYACHGTKSVWRLGKKASHGCIRLRTSNAKKLYYLVKNVGKNHSYINIRH